jgi:two-component system response regulator PilR (NtrC family)
VTEKGRIIIIDDDESVRKGLGMVLEAMGYTVDTAKDGKEAIEKSNANFYNLALVDIRLPDMEGTKLLTSMKETDPKMVKIVLTGYPSVDNAIEAADEGADAYLMKPVVNMDTFLNTISEHLKKQEEAKRHSKKSQKN